MISPKTPRLILFLTMALLLAFIIQGCAPIDRIVTLIQYKSLNKSDRYILEGDRLAQEDRFSEALLSYRQAVEINPKNARANFKLGQFYNSQGRKRMAYRFLLNGLDLSPDSLEIKNALDNVNILYSQEHLRLRWSIQAGLENPTGITDHNDIIVISYEDGLVTAINSTDGRILWIKNLPSIITSPPSNYDGFVFIGAQNGNLYTLSEKDGSILWQFPTQAPIYASTSKIGDHLYCASNDGYLYSLNLTGNLIWKFKSGSGFHAQAVENNGVVFIGSTDSKFYAIDAATGSLRWPTEIQTQGAIESPASISGDRIFFGSDDSRVYAISAQSGGEYWRFSTPDAVFAQPILVDEILYIASSGQIIAAVNPISGEAYWEKDVPIQVNNPPAFYQNILFVSGPGDPNVYAIEKDTGTLLWNYDTQDWIAGGPIIQNEILYVLGKDGMLMAFKLE